MNKKMGDGAPECKETDRALKNIPDEYRQLHANIPGMVYLFAQHPDGGFSFPYVTDASRKLFDLEPEEIMHDWTAISSLIHPDDQARFIKSIEISADTVQPWAEELRFIVNNEIRWYDCMSRPKLRSNGDILWSGFVNEITERKRLSAELTKGQHLLNNIIDQNPFPIWISDEKGVLIRINPACCDLWNLRKEELVDNYNILNDPIVEKQGHLFLIQSVFDEGKTVHFTLDNNSEQLKQLQQNRSPNANIEVTISPVKDAMGAVTNAIFIYRDITNQKLVEDALIRSEDRFRSTFEQAAVGIAHVGLDGRWLRINQRLCDMVGYSRKEMLTLTFQDITYPDDLDSDLKNVQKILDGKIQTYDMEKRYIRKNGGVIWINLTVSMLRHPSGEPKYFIAVIEEISSRKEAENAKQSHIHMLTSMERIDKIIRSTTDLDQMMREALDAVLSIFKGDRAFLLYPCDPESPTWSVPMERTVPEYPGAAALNCELPMYPWIADLLHKVIESDGVVKFGPKESNPVPSDGAKQFQIQSMITMAVYPKVDKPWVFGIQQCSFPRVWSDEEKTLLQEIGRRIADALTNLIAFDNLQKSEDRFRTLVENIPGFVYRCELRVPWRLHYVSEAAFELTGYPSKDFVENNTIDFGKLILPEDLPMVERAADQGIENHTAFEISYRIRHVSGEIRWVYEKGRATYNDDGAPLWLDGLIVDITKNRLAEENLRRSEMFLNEVAHIAKIGGWEMDLITRKAKWTKGTYDIVEIEPDQPIPGPDEHIGYYLPEYRPLVEEAMRALIEDNEPLDFEARLKTVKGNVKWCRALGQATIEDDKCVKLKGTLQDISEHKLIESELQAFAETQGVLLREVNHRVKNNLMIVISMLHKEKDRIEKIEEAHSLPLINKLLGRIEGLSTVHSLLSAGGWQPLYLSRLCEQVIREVLKSHEVDAVLNISPSDVKIDSDQAHNLALVINELATNSLKYALPEVARTIMTVEISEFEDNTISITFRDNGPGYSKSVIQGEYAGSCIGLDLINGIINKSLNGGVSLSNEGGAVAVLIFKGNIRHR